MAAILFESESVKMILMAYTMKLHFLYSSLTKTNTYKYVSKNYIDSSKNSITVNNSQKYTWKYKYFLFIALGQMDRMRNKQ